jgi:vitamin B12 transporter
MMRAGALLSLAVLTPVVLDAQTPVDTIELAPVVVSATRAPVSSDLVASSVTVLEIAELRQRGLRSVAEALRMVGSAVVLESGSYGGQTSLFVRGGESDYVRVLLDGVPLNQPGGAIDLADLGLENVERIEIVRGPGSVLYGSDAVTGVVQIFTREGTGSPGFNLSARGGSYGTSEYLLGAAGGNRRAGFAVEVTHFASDGIFELNNEYRSSVLSARARLAPDERTHATLVYRYNDKTYHFPTDAAGRPVDSNQYSAEHGPLASLIIQRTVLPALGIQASGFLREARLEYSDAADSPASFPYESSDLVRRAGGGLQVDWRPGSSTVVTAGLEYEHEDQRGQNTFDATNVSRWNRALLAQVVAEPAPAVSLNGGVRVEHNSQFGGYATYRTGLVYRVGDRTRLRGSLGTGFKEPTFFESFATGFVRGNPHLDPERSTSWEFAIERDVGGVGLRLGYFHQRFRDLIEYSSEPLPPDMVNYFNVAGARAHGFEIGASLSVPRRWEARVEYTYLSTEVLEGGPSAGPGAAFVPGEPLVRRPGHVLTAVLHRSIGAKGLAVLEGRWLGSREDIDYSSGSAVRVTLPGHLRMDAALEYALVRPERGAGISVTARVENLFDADAQEIANFPTRGRSLFLGGKVRITT